MNQMDLFDELTFIDDDLILEAHEKPASWPHLRLGGLRKAAVLIAAVMLLVVSALATGGEFGVPRPQGWVRGNATTRYDTDYENQAMIIHDMGVYAIQHGEEANVPAITLTRAHATEIWSKTECQGYQIQIIQEAMILMPDGKCHYKAQVTEGTDKVVAVMDNLLDGVAGEIANVRLTVCVLTPEGDQDYDRHTIPGPDGMEWTLLQTWNGFLPTQVGTDFPVGVDARFPDMQYNYDGRDSAVE